MLEKSHKSAIYVMLSFAKKIHSTIHLKSKAHGVKMASNLRQGDESNILSVRTKKILIQLQHK